MADIEGEDEFVDAEEVQPMPTSMDLDTAMLDAKQAVHYFFNNNFDEARMKLEPWASSSMYHCLGTSVFAFLQAILTFEHSCIDKASEALKQSMALCSKHRKHNTITQNIGKIVKKTNYDSYTIEEVHAELCYAESLLLKAMLTFVEDETMVSFVKAGLKIRTCFLSYKECLCILKSRKWENETQRAHFESGVQMGIGAFNLMISLLPGRVIKLLEFIGFSGDKAYGLAQLQAGYENRNGLRQVLCAMTLLSYNLIVSYVLSHTDGDLEWSEKALDEELRLYPNGVWFLFFKGRLEFTKGKVEDAVTWYTKSWKSQQLWPQFHHICFWELMWAHCALQEWNESAVYAGYLAEQSNWSRTIYLYQKAAALMMTDYSSNSEMQSTVDTLVMQAPTFKQRIAGKSLPMEKFVVRKAERYFAQKKNLVLPALELMYVWNLFKVLGKRQDLLMKMFSTIEDKEQSLKNEAKSEYQADNEALVLLLKGACLRQMGQPLQAEDCLRRALDLEKKIKEDTYILPYSKVELSLLAHDQNNTQVAIALLEDAKKNYTGYSLESRLHFRIHSTLMDLTGKKPEELNVNNTTSVSEGGSSVNNSASAELKRSYSTAV